MIQENSVIKDYLITGTDGKKYKVKFYSLDLKNPDERLYHFDKLLERIIYQKIRLIY